MNQEQPNRTATHAMPEISIEEDCGNSPRKQFLSDFYVAFVERDEEAILSMLTSSANSVTEICRGLRNIRVRELRIVSR